MNSHLILIHGAVIERVRNYSKGRPDIKIESVQVYPGGLEPGAGPRGWSPDPGRGMHHRGGWQSKPPPPFTYFTQHYTLDVL